ncbi:MAG: hypothetical protein AAB019_10505 [Planctomycetota bacterium]
MDDLIQFAAYAIIFIIIGIVSLIKKAKLSRQQRVLLEERKKPRENRGKIEPGLRPAYIPAGTQPVSRKEIDRAKEEEEEMEEVMEEETEPAEMDIEEALRRALGIPSMEKPKMVVLPKVKLIKKFIPSEKVIPSPDIAGIEPGKIIPEDSPAIVETLAIVKEKDLPWLTHFDKSASSEFKKMVIFSEIIAPPLSLRKRQTRLLC